MNRRQQLWLRAKQRYGARLATFIKRSFPFWERAGLHLTFNHYYEPVPDTRKLKDELWAAPSELVGIRMNEEAQRELLSVFVSRFKHEYDRLPVDEPPLPHRFYLNNPGFPSVDAEILYCMIRHVKPKRVIEIGSGHSTYLAAEALLKNQEEDRRELGELIAIEPYPNEVLKAGFPGLSQLIAKPVQDVSLSTFQRLQERDILFIDSSHMLKIGSDVQYEYLEVLPRLNTGVLVHVHDIHFPMEYPKDLVLGSRRFWTEQYLVQAFLAFNRCFEIVWAGTFMHVRHPEALSAAFRLHAGMDRWPSSLWIRRCSGP